MPERSCPSCGLEVAAHQTLCPRCRTPIPSDAGPLAPSADGSSIRVAAPPPRVGRSGAPLPPPEGDARRGPGRADPHVAGTPGRADPDDEPTVLAPLDVEPTVDAGRAPEPTVALGPDQVAPPRAAPAPPGAGTDEVTAVAPGGAAPAWAPDEVHASAAGGPGPGWGTGEATAVAPGGAPTGDGPSSRPTDPTAAGEPRATPSAGTLGVPGAPTLDDRGNLPGGIAGIVGAVLVVVGVVLPWLDVAGETVSGWSASADARVLVAVAGVATVAAALVVGGARSLVLRVLLAAAGVVTLGLGAYELASVGTVEDLDPSPGVGLYVVLLGGAVLVAAGALTRHRRFR